MGGAIISDDNMSVIAKNSLSNKPNLEMAWDISFIFTFKFHVRKPVY